MKETLTSLYKQTGNSYKKRVQGVGVYGILVAFVVICLLLALSTPAF